LLATNCGSCSRRWKLAFALEQVALGFRHGLLQLAIACDRETLERLIGEVKPLLDRA
jgi:hypothetical protein